MTDLSGYKFPIDVLPTIDEYKEKYNFGKKNFNNNKKNSEDSQADYSKKEKADVSNIAYLMQTNDFYEYLLNCDFTYIPAVRRMILKQMFINIASVFECILLRFPWILQKNYCNKCKNRDNCIKIVSKKYIKNSFSGAINALKEKDNVFELEASFYKDIEKLKEVRNRIHLGDEDIGNQYNDNDFSDEDKYKHYKDLLDNILIPAIAKSREKHMKYNNKKDTCFVERQKQ